MNYLLKIIVVFLINLFTIISLLKGQTPLPVYLGNPSNSVTESSQQITSFGAFGDSKVNHNTGQLNMSIPLWNINEKQFEMPINLHYSSGVKHNQNSSWVGLSWNLIAGGFISRNIIGAADENENGYWNFENRLSLFNPAHVAGTLDKNDSLLISNYKGPGFFPGLLYTDTILVDSKPDVFSFNFNGYQGEFIILKGGGNNVIFDASNNPTIINPGNPNEYKIVMLSKSDLKITMDGQLSSFTIITPNGVKYIFGKPVSQHTALGNNNTLHHDFEQFPALSSISQINRINFANWYLTKIILANNEEIDFEYDHKGLLFNKNIYYNLKLDTLHDVFDNTAGEILHTGNIGIGQSVGDKSEHWNYSRIAHYTNDSIYRVSKITSPNQTIDFYATQTQLAYVNLNDWKLDSVVIRNTDGVRVKKWNLEYDYFYKDVSPNCNLVLQPHKLKLIKLYEVSTNLFSAAQKPYLFEYEETKSTQCYPNVTPPNQPPIPNMLSNERWNGYDYWGYYNGKNNSTMTDLPGFDVYIDTKRYTLSGNNRNPDNDIYNNYPYMRAYSIKKVTNPFGGESIFEFEPNDYGYILDKESNEKFSENIKISLNSVGSNNISQNFLILENQRVSLKATLASRNFQAIIGGYLFQGPTPSITQPGDPGNYFCHGYSYLYPIENNVLNQFTPFSKVSTQFPYTFASSTAYQWLNSISPTIYGPIPENHGYLFNLLCKPVLTSPLPFPYPNSASGSNPIARPNGSVKIEKEITPGVFSTVFEFGVGKWDNCYINPWGDFIYLGDLGQDLDPGYYKLTVDCPNSINNGPFAKADLVYHTGVPSKSQIGGGIRIKSITTNNKFNNSFKKHYTYLKKSETGRSSGHLSAKVNFVNYYQMPSLTGNSFPVFQWNFNTQQYDVVYNFEERNITNFISFDVSSHSMFPTGIIMGPDVEYEEVQEYEQNLNLGNINNGHVNYKFYSFGDVDCNDEIGLISITSNFIKRGKLKEVSVFDNTNQLIKKSTYTYTNLVSNQNLDQYVQCFTGKVINHHCFEDFHPNILNIPALLKVNFETYKIKSSNWHLNSVHETEVFPSGVFSKTTNYYRDNVNHLQVNRIESSNSKGETEKVYNYYPLDYVNTNLLATNLFVKGINYMKFNNYKENFIEQIKTITKPPSSEKVKEATLNSFKFSPTNNNVMNTSTEVVNVENTYDLVNHTLSTQSVGQIIKDSRYKLSTEIVNYDFKNNILLLNNFNDGIPTKESYVYGYSNSIPIAVVQNASENEIAYTSFETNDDYGNCVYSNALIINSNDALSGFKEYQLYGNNDIIVPVNANIGKKMIFTIWSKIGTGNPIVNYNGSVLNPIVVSQVFGWNFLEYRFVSNLGSLDITGTTILDELRLYPEDAKMNTICVNPLVGKVTVCDQNNKIIYYDYDDFFRNSIIKDQNRKILSKSFFGIQAND